MKPQSPWWTAHTKLKRLYEDRVQDMTQREFGRVYGIGTQSMVAQYLNGDRPLNYDVAAKFARGLRCKIDDFCPEMVNTLNHEIIPYMGKLVRRAAVSILVLLSPGFAPSDAKATSHNAISAAQSLAKLLSYYTFSAIGLLLNLFNFEHSGTVTTGRKLCASGTFFRSFRLSPAGSASTSLLGFSSQEIAA